MKNNRLLALAATTITSTVFFASLASAAPCGYFKGKDMPATETNPPSTLLTNNQISPKGNNLNILGLSAALGLGLLGTGMLLKKRLDRRSAGLTVNLAVTPETSATPRSEFPEISEFPIFVPAEALVPKEESTEDLAAIH
ncbi:MAG: hypothetical protein HC916_17205 [Coleofasciculaceae cyanobacterium SM2_1_6]|nr:hypothetical protein [Coleofasciculaceae cyanobacterium SM2_1_6]